MQATTQQLTEDQPGIVSLMRQSQFYKIYKYTPRLLAALGEEGDIVLDAFLSWMDKNNLEMEWSLHLYLLHWLCHHSVWKKIIDNDIKKELLIAAVTRWSLLGMEHVTAKGMQIYSSCLPDAAIGIWKSTEMARPAKIVMLPLSDDLRPARDAYKVSFSSGNWEGLEWQTLHIPDRI